MRITIQLTSHSDESRGENERMAEFVTLDFKRNGDKRDAFLREIVEKLKRMAKEHNAKFDQTHSLKPPAE